MSYKPYEEEGKDSLSVLFSRMADCFTFCRKMTNVKNEPEDFLLWFEKAKLADRRTTYRYVKANYQDFDNPVVRQIIDSFIEQIDNTRLGLE